MENPSLRVRLVFEDRQMLSQSQKSQGLKRCWYLLLPSQHQSISDLSDHILHKFDLLHSCPHGLLLTMDGFVLPPFESTGILKEKDIICVKKGSTSSDIIKVDDTADLIEEVEATEKQPLHAGMLLLANEEFEKKIGGYQSEPEEEGEEKEEEEEEKEGEERVDTLHEENSDENAVSKKRKAPKKRHGSKKKKRRLAADDGVENSVCIRKKRSCNDGVNPKKNPCKKKVLNVQSKPDKRSTPESCEKSNEDVELTPKMESDQLEEDDKGVEDVTHAPEGTKKLPSRSARRKKSKRRWLREMAKTQKKEIVQPSKPPAKWNRKLANTEKKDVVDHPKGLLHWKQLPTKDFHKKVERKKLNQNSDAEDKFVPFEDRPGHIRFEPVEEDQAVEQHQPSMQTFQWNGITDKKKGQKWGKDKFALSWRDNHKEINKEFTEKSTISGEILVNHTIDFDKVPPLTSFLKEGDVIAYRLLELSSSWTPELSSFRVGKVTRYNPESSKVLLMSLPEYPILTEKQDEDESVPQPENSLYREDGSLEIDFSSLIDLRLVKHGDADPAKLAPGLADDGPMGNKKDVSGVTPSGKDNKHTPVSTGENGEVNLWEQFSEALSVKKAELSQENGWNTESSGRSSWSYRALRGSALGPTMAILRSKNQI